MNRRITENYIPYGKLEAARVKIVLAMHLIDEAHMNIAESGCKVKKRDALLNISGALEQFGHGVIDEMNKLEEGRG